jgi:hypothetical protein
MADLSQSEAAAPPTKRREWLMKLAGLRADADAHVGGASLQAIFDDLRGK